MDNIEYGGFGTLQYNPMRDVSAYNPEFVGKLLSLALDIVHGIQSLCELYQRGKKEGTSYATADNGILTLEYALSKVIERVMEIPIIDDDAKDRINDILQRLNEAGVDIDKADSVLRDLDKELTKLREQFPEGMRGGKY